MTSETVEYFFSLEVISNVLSHIEFDGLIFFFNLLLHCSTDILFIDRKYKPLHIQSMTFPSLWYSGRFSPFESPPPPFEKWTEQVEKKTRCV